MRPFRKWRLEAPPYKQKIFFCFGGTPEEFLKAVAEEDGGVAEDHGEFSSGICIPNRMTKEVAPTFWLWMKMFRGTVNDYAFLVHETNHLNFHILSWLEIPQTEDTMEPVAALQECLFEQVLSCIRKGRVKDE